MGSCSGTVGNSHWTKDDINSKMCQRMINLAEEGMTVEWANASFEQRTWQWIHRIALLSDCHELIPLLSGNSVFMIAERLYRCAVRGYMPNMKALMSHPITDAAEFESSLR